MLAVSGAERGILSHSHQSIRVELNLAVEEADLEFRFSQTRRQQI